MSKSLQVRDLTKVEILTILSKFPSFGARLIERMEEANDYEHLLHPGQVYPKLRWLTSNGFIEEVDKDIIKNLQIDNSSFQARQGRPRKYYRITDKGRAELMRIEKVIQRLKQGQISHQVC